MPDNSLSNLMNTFIMPMALPILREACMMPALVSQNFSAAAHEKNAVIRIAMPQDLGPADDFDTELGSSSTALGDGKIDMILDRWKYKQFEMNDKEMRETVTSAILPSAVEAAIKSVANAVDLDLLGLYKDVPYSVGAPGVLPSSTAEIVDARKVMNDNLVPTAPRFILLNSSAEAAYLKEVMQWINTGPVSTAALKEAYLGRLHGFDMFTDQLMLQHVAGSAVNDTLSVAQPTPAGSQAIPLTGSTGTKTLNQGDIFTIAGVLDARGNPCPFVVTATTAAVTGNFGSLAIYPAIPTDVAANSAVVFQSSPTGFTGQSLAFHRDAFMFAARTLTNEQSENSTISVATDPVTGIPLRLETWRDPRFAKRMWRFDILYGVKTIRPNLAVRMNG